MNLIYAKRICVWTLFVFYLLCWYNRLEDLWSMASISASRAAIQYLLNWLEANKTIKERTQILKFKTIINDSPKWIKVCCSNGSIWMRRGGESFNILRWEWNWFGFTFIRGQIENNLFLISFRSRHMTSEPATWWLYTEWIKYQWICYCELSTQPSRSHKTFLFKSLSFPWATL